MVQEVQSSWGACMSLDVPDGTGHLPTLRSVGIQNLVEVTSHGFAQFSYNDRGELIELSGHRCTMTADRDGRVLMGAFPDDLVAQDLPSGGTSS